MILFDTDTITHFSYGNENVRRRIESIGHFGRLNKQKSLKKMGRADMLIACIALAHNALLVTRNIKDFTDVAGLKTDNWVD